MTEEKLQELLSVDLRYTREAYAFVFDALRYAQEAEESATCDSGLENVPYHVTGPQICEAARCLAVARYGMLAGRVLKQWGICRTSDLGELVYHLIEIGLMHRADGDRREDFNDVFDFETELLEPFSFRPKHREERS